jgi:DNA polymerase I
MSEIDTIINSDFIFVDAQYDISNIFLEKLTLVSNLKTLAFEADFIQILSFLSNFSGKVYVFDAKKLYKNTLINYPTIDCSLLNLLDISVAKSLCINETAKTIQQKIDNCEFISVVELLESSLPERVSTLWHTVESPLALLLAKIELNGVYVDQQKLTNIQAELGSAISGLESEIQSNLGANINLNSTKQLGEVLVEKGYSLGKKGKSGNVSTDRSVLEMLVPEDESGLIKKILEYRTVNKLQSGFAVPLLNLVDKKTSRIHTTYDQTSVPTGRISSNSPNLQNIPIKDDIYGKKMRSCFACEDGNILIGADYSQAELRFLAHFTKDETLLEVFKSGQDVHSRTAAEIFEIPIEEVSKVQRRVGKTLNFALLYQQGTFGTAKQLGITVKEAQGYTDRYFARFSKVKPFIEETLEKATNEGYVETYSGRRRYFTNLKSSNHFLKMIDQRAAFNAVLQGSNADIIKMAMLGLEKRFKLEKIDYRLVLQVHDELVIEVCEKDKELAAKILKEEMELGQPLFVPLEVDVDVGKDWSELK